MIIYKLTNIRNGKIYIGQDSKNNPKYLGSGVYLLNAQKKHGRDNFIKEIIEYCEDIDELNQKERYWIAFYNSTDPNIGYNLSPGGNSTLGWHMTDAQKLALSKERKGKKLSPETIAKLKLPGRGKGKKLSKEHKEKISKTSLGRITSQETKNKLSKANKGQIQKPDSEATRRKKSLSHIGKTCSEETRAKLTGRKHTETSLEKMRKARLGTRATESTKAKLRAEQKKRVDLRRIFRFNLLLFLINFEIGK